MRSRALAAALVALTTACSACEESPARCAPSAEAFDVTLASLADEMVDLDRLARPADPPFVAAMASSYDRRSTSPDDPAGWFANRDAENFDRVDERDGRTEHVLLEVDAPGVLTRIWTATPRGTLRIYLDGAESPVIEEDFAELLNGDVEPFEAPFAYRVSNREVTNCARHTPDGAGNLYFPIPFARSARVTIDDPAIFYQVSYRRYAPDVRVQPYSEAALAEAACALEAAAAALESPPAPAGEITRDTLQVTAEGARATFDAGPDGAVIRELAITLPAIDDARARATAVELTFDGERTVRGPLLELLGQGGPDLRDTRSLGAVVEGRRLALRLPMPFRESAELRLVATAGAPYPVDVEARIAPVEFGEYGRHLHARWMPSRVVPTTTPSEHTELDVAGSGDYLGNVLDVTNSSRAWWGEGDERIYVDGEAFPSFFGTGTEDYYGYAWCSAVEFARPYHGQTRVQGPETYGRSSLFRWHVLDRIPFTSRLRFDLETTHWKTYARVGYEALHFWYAAPGGDAETEPLDPAQFATPDIAAHEPAAADRDDIPHRWDP